MWFTVRYLSTAGINAALYHRPRLTPGWAAAVLVLAPAAGPALPAQDASEPHESYLERHILHWALAAGMSLADNEYEDRVGYSTDPLLFGDPPGIDRWVRDRVMVEDFHDNGVLRQRGNIALALGAGAAVLGNLGREGAGRDVLDDLTALAEIWFFDKGASGLVKNIVGRRRPKLEFIDENETLTPVQREEEMEKRSNHQSFYSGATSRQFSLLSYADRIVAGRVSSHAARAASFLVFNGFAAYVGWSRIQSDKHYMTDVVAGAAAGIFIARGFHRAHHPDEDRHARGHTPQRRVRLASVHVGRGGAALMLAVQP